MDAEESFRVECSDEEIQKELKNGVYGEAYIYIFPRDKVDDEKVRITLIQNP